MPSPRTSPIQSPVVMAPTSLLVSRTALVISPVTTDWAPSLISSRLTYDVRLGIVENECGERCGHRRGRNHSDLLHRQRIELFGDRNDVLVVRQDHHLIGVDGLDCGEELGRRRVERLPTGDDSLHTELPEQLGQAIAAATATTAHVTAGNPNPAPE